jgi:hypothetical protein
MHSFYENQLEADENYFFTPCCPENMPKKKGPGILTLEEPGPYQGSKRGRLPTSNT